MSESPGNVSLSEIVTVMVHDLNNPIAALGTNLRFLETLVQASASPDARETMADMHMLCDTLRRLVANLGMFGQAEPPTARKGHVDVLMLTKGALERLDALATTSEQKLSFESTLRTGEVFVESDPVLCERALDNLMAFAIERAVSRSTITVSIMRGEHVGVQISCTTRPETAQPSTHSSRSRILQSAYGRGLSLYGARIAAEATGCRIEVGREAPTHLKLTLVLDGDDKQIA
jgi:signal transduction histidine kinase